MGAIGSHGDDSQRLGEAVHPVSAALILADKSDVHRSRVRNKDMATFDQHDRVNYASESSFLRVDRDQRRITLELTIDTTISHVMNYFEIFLPRMLMCRRAAEFLDCAFHIDINKRGVAVAMGTLITNLGIGRRSVTEGSIDPYMIVTTAVLIGFGLVAIWSADGGGGPITPGSVVVRQLIFVIVGMPVIFLMTAIDYRYMKSLAWAHLSR